MKRKILFGAGAGVFLFIAYFFLIRKPKKTHIGDSEVEIDPNKTPSDILGDNTNSQTETIDRPIINMPFIGEVQIDPSSRLRMRKTPSINSEIVGYIGNETELLIPAHSGVWYEILDPANHTNSLYVHKDYVIYKGVLTNLDLYI